jgi:hypothetical protein
MNRLAIFVEGYTEVVFVKKLIEEIAGKNKVLIEHKKISGGSKSPRRVIRITASKPTGQQYYVLIFDCGGDGQVKTRIQEEHDNLTKAGYLGIIGIRDVRPVFNHSDIPRLEANLPKYIKTTLAPVSFILSIMEIEAWFLCETTHFTRIEPSITVNAIRNNLGFDPENEKMELRLCPANDLDDCYAIGGKSYDKTQTKIDITVNALDYALIYLDVRKKILYLDRLISNIETFLAR